MGAQRCERQSTCRLIHALWREWAQWWHAMVHVFLRVPCLGCASCPCSFAKSNKGVGAGAADSARCCHCRAAPPWWTGSANRSSSPPATTTGACALRSMRPRHSHTHPQLAPLGGPNQGHLRSITPARPQLCWNCRPT
jgi:hypothetical protein